jgi:hypothetical protein
VHHAVKQHCPYLVSCLPRNNVYGVVSATSKCDYHNLGGVPGAKHACPWCWKHQLHHHVGCTADTGIPCSKTAVPEMPSVCRHQAYFSASTGMTCQTTVCSVVGTMRPAQRGIAHLLLVAWDGRGLCFAALSQLAKDVWGTMRPRAGAAWTASDYAAAVKAILESPHNAVDSQELVAVIGERPLEALLQANQLALRPYSSWATDINPHAFGADRDATVVTAPTSMHLYLMHRKEKQLLARLNSQQVGWCYDTPHCSWRCLCLC